MCSRRTDDRASTLIVKLDALQGQLASAPGGPNPAELTDAMAASADIRRAAQTMSQLLGATIAQLDNPSRELDNSRIASQTDGLTGLRNRSAVDTALRERLAQHQPGREDMGLVIVDIISSRTSTTPYGHVGVTASGRRSPTLWSPESTRARHLLPAMAAKSSPLCTPRPAARPRGASQRNAGCGFRRCAFGTAKSAP